MFTLHLNVTQMLDDSVNSKMNTESDIFNLSIFAIPNYMWKSDLSDIFRCDFTVG